MENWFHNNANQFIETISKQIPYHAIKKMRVTRYEMRKESLDSSNEIRDARCENDMAPKK
nr:hypothetical protein BCU01_15345 [Vibrio splendidus]